MGSYTPMEEPDGATSTQTDPKPPQEPTETTFSRRARQKLEKEHRELSINTSRRSSASSTSPRSPITLQLKRSIHHPYRHVSTPKPKESHRSSNSERRDSRERSHKTDEKTRKRSKNHSSNRDRGEMEVNEADLYPPPSSEHKKSSRNITEKFAEKNDENAAFYTPPQEITSNSSTMTDYSPDSDPMSRYGSAHNSPLNTSVINTFDSAYGVATIDAEKTRKVRTH